ncbi:MAG: hypothetical protein JWP97_1036 [Labilithrix sp.]|nr:hypothetical protein [Labilithrix sp.]
MGGWALALAGLALASGVLPGWADARAARAPQRIPSFWLGLDPPAARASAGAIVVLRPPLERRVRIPGGSFVMGSTPSEMVRAIKLCEREPEGASCSDGASVAQWIRAEGYAHEVTLAAFDLDRTEVPVRRYARCVVAGGCAPASYPSGDRRYDNPEYPVTHVRWEDAAQYCAWAGGRLPTEAEWEMAARGRAGHLFPWGETYNGHLANHGSKVTGPLDGRSDAPTDASDGFEGLAPIGSFPDGATPSGLLDMAGNAAEWVADFYDRDEDGYGYGRGAVTGPKGASFGPYGHVIRGGSYLDAPHWLRTAARVAWPYPTRFIGFRCAYDVKDGA